jgi:hypothetical protein
MLAAAKMLADVRLDRRAKHLAAITPHVPVFVCRNLLILANRDLAAEASRCSAVQSVPNRR